MTQKENTQNSSDEKIPTKEAEKIEKSSRIDSLVNTYERYNFLSILIAIIAVVTILIIAADECRHCFQQLNTQQTHNDNNVDYRTYWVYGRNVESGYLKHVFKVLHRLRYKHNPNASSWDLLWAHDYPFRKLYPILNQLQPHQKVNHFPGCGYITNKVDLATSNLKYIPPAFKLPDDKNKLLEYSKKYPNISFVQKNNDHRNIKVKRLDQIDLDKNGTFIQQFVDKPLLVNGHKFDIGIYTIITSIDPLRVYIYNGDALLRFCPVKYYPFDPENLDKYVVGDDYLPIWQIPALDYYYNVLGFGMRESLNAYLESIGKKPAKLWGQIEDSIRVLLLAKELKILQVVNKFKSKRNFFEMVRIDFVVDEDLNAYLLEANMSPNLSSAHFPPNQLLYEQVLYNLFSLVGIAERIRRDSDPQVEDEMIVSDKNLATFPKECNSQLCRSSCMAPICQLCQPCLSPATRENLIQAYKEHMNRGDCKRIFPPTIHGTNTEEIPELEHYSAENQLQYRWFLGKCQIDPAWC